MNTKRVSRNIPVYPDVPRKIALYFELSQVYSDKECAR